MGEKVQKILANLGYASRREIERWISDGRVRINDQIIGLGARAEPEDQISVDGRLVHQQQGEPDLRVLIYHKPVDEICTRSDPEGRPTVFRNLPKIPGQRWIAVGRLDINSSGLMLFTNNGELANRLMHPSYEIEREYAVRVLGEVSPEMIEKLKKGVELDDGTAKFVTICDAGGEGANRWYHVTLKEGRNREVRRIWEAVGRQVSRLHRIRYGPVSLPRSLRPGNYKELEESARDLLLKTVGLQSAVAEEAGVSRKFKNKNRSEVKARTKPTHRQTRKKRR